MANEHKIQTECLKYLKDKKHRYWRNNTGAFKDSYGHYIRYGEVGSPDIFVVVDGFLICLEIKDPKGKQSDEQKKWEQAIKEAGAEYYLVTEVNQLKEIGL